MKRLISKSHLSHLPLLTTVCVVPGSLAQISAPRGCNNSLDSLYYNLCDLSAVWGIAAETFAAAGLLAAVVLLIVLLASLPFIRSGKHRSALWLHVFFLVFTCGLFALTFVFIVGKNFTTCVCRRFLFGVLFAGCFSCLLMQAVRLHFLARRNSGSRGWVWCLGALGLWLVEVIINSEWLIITIARFPVNVTQTPATAASCDITNSDFVLALTYVLNLLLAVLVVPVPMLTGQQERLRRAGALILLTGLLSAGIWVAWIVMYVYGNSKRGRPSWDDPTMAIALASNGWTFLLLNTIPAMCSLSEDDEETAAEEDLYPSRGYENILRDPNSQRVYIENKAFSMDEPNTGKTESPYSGYNGLTRSCVYQPTELAIITGAMGKSYDSVIPRASAITPIARSSPSTQAENKRHILTNETVHRRPQ